MLGTVLRHLVDESRTSIKELETITGRGSSTIYRWLSGESQPALDDLRSIVRQVADDGARRTIVATLTSDLPVCVQWIEGHVTEEEAGAVLDGHDVLGRTLLALECVSGLLAEEHEAMREHALSTEMLARVVTLMDNAIAHLTTGRKLLTRYRPTD